MELGLSPEDFWKLSWYEWGLYLLRKEKEVEKEKFLWEEGWEQTRAIWCVIANVHGNKKSPQDLIKLPRDKDIKTDITQESIKDIELLAKKRFGSTIKKKK